MNDLFTSRNASINHLRNKMARGLISDIEKIQLDMLEELREIDRRYYSVD